MLIALRMGAFQLLYLDRIPARAAIDECVELAKQAGHKFASKMVNAVLRKLSGGAPHFDLLEESAAGLALIYAHPQWMVERWIERYGLETARGICIHGQKQPALTVRVTGPEVDAELARDGVSLEAGKLLMVARARCRAAMRRRLEYFVLGASDCRMRVRNLWRNWRAPVVGTRRG